MPPDHINIIHPEKRCIDSDTYRSVLQIDQLKVELAQLQTWHRAVCADLESIFTRIRRGEPAELHYPDGTMIRVIAAAPPLKGEPR